eukprot:765988-Hanusia_phi.AAC.23
MEKCDGEIAGIFQQASVTTAHVKCHSFTWIISTGQFPSHLIRFAASSVQKGQFLATMDPFPVQELVRSGMQMKAWFPLVVVQATHSTPS